MKPLVSTRFLCVSRAGLLALFAIALFVNGAVPAAAQTGSTERARITWGDGAFAQDGFDLWVYDSQGNVASGGYSGIPRTTLLYQEGVSLSGSFQDSETADIFSDEDLPSTRRFCFAVSWLIDGFFSSSKLVQVVLTDPGGAQRDLSFTADSDEGSNWVVIGGSPPGSELNGEKCGPGKPKTRECKKPRGKTHSRRACLRILAKEANVSLECKLTGKGVPKSLKRWRSCHSPKRYRGLRPGRKVFQARAVDSSGAKSQPATHKWTILP